MEYYNREKQQKKNGIKQMKIKKVFSSLLFLSFLLRTSCLLPFPYYSLRNDEEWWKMSPKRKWCRHSSHSQCPNVILIVFSSLCDFLACFIPSKWNSFILIRIRPDLKSELMCFCGLNVVGFWCVCQKKKKWFIVFSHSVP